MSDPLTREHYHGREGMTRRYRGCYRGPCYTKVVMLGGRLVLSVYQYRRAMRLNEGTR